MWHAVKMNEEYMYHTHANIQVIQMYKISLLDCSVAKHYIFFFMPEKHTQRVAANFNKL